MLYTLKQIKAWVSARYLLFLSIFL